MTAAAGFSTSLQIASASTAMTNEATTMAGGTTVLHSQFQITNAAKRAVDPTATVLVEIDTSGTGSSYVTATGYTLDYLYGRVTFPTDQGASTLVRVSGAYMNRLPFLLANSVSLSCMRDLVESTAFAAGAGSAAKTRIADLEDCSVEIGHLSSVFDDVGAGLKLETLRAANTTFFVEVQVGGQTDFFRGWFLIEEATHKATPSSLRETTLKLCPAPFKGNGQSSYALYGFGS
jgi:hypothetical protein